MKQSTLISLFAAFLAISTAGAEGPSARQFADQFFTLFMSGDTDKAFDQLFAGSMIVADLTKVEAIKRQTSENLPHYGKPLGYELITERKIGTAVVRLVYVLKMEKQAVVWEFFFYRAKDNWMVAGVSINDEFKGLTDADSPPRPNKAIEPAASRRTA